MKIAIISNGYMWFPVESGTLRLFDIARAFAESGWETDVITTSFEHFEKRQRDQKRIRAQHYPFRISFIPSPPYRKNIGVKRILSNEKTAINLSGYLEQYGRKYDAVYCTIPSNRVAATAAGFCHRNHIPFIVDIEDLWPEAMQMVIRRKSLQKLLLGGLQRDADYVYRCADGIIGTSDDYTARAFLNRPQNIPAKTVYVGCDLDSFDESVRKYGAEIIKTEKEIWVTYAGSLGESYGLQYLIEAAGKLQDRKEWNIRLKLLGTGTMEKKLKLYAKEMGCTNVDFPGFLPYSKMAACLSKSDIVVNSFRKGAAQSFVNKIGDYLASGKPMINTLENPGFQKFVKEEKLGLNIEAENPDMIADAVLYLLKHPKEYQEMAENARRVAEEKFDRRKTYPEIVQMTEEVVRKKTSDAR